MSTPQYITDSDGNRTAVILDMDTYRAMVAALEDAEDSAWARDYTARKAAGLLTPDELDVLPIDQAIAESEAAWAEREQQAA